MPITGDDLRKACQESLAHHADEPWAKRWHQAVVEFIEWARKASPSERCTIEFQRRLWDDNPVAATGQGQISVDAALEDARFREIVAKLFEQTLPETGQARTDTIRALFDEVIRELKPKVNRTPWLKVLRVFAVAFPTEFTSIAHRRRLGKIHRGIGGPRGRLHVVDRSRAILDVLDNVLGPVNTASLTEVVTRLILPWWLYMDHMQGGDDDATETVSESPGEVRLNPLPAARRRGMLAIGGYVDTILAILEFVKDGCERDDLREHIRSINPKLSEKSVPTNIHALIAEWGVLRSEGSRIELTDRGAEFLESGDPIELSDWLLTRVLGFDYLIWYVKQHQPLRKLDAVKELKTVNPGWTSNYAPNAMTNWQVKLGLLEQLQQGMLRLSNDGERWAELITWTPEKLAADPETEESDAADDRQANKDTEIRRPELETILRRIAEAGVVAPESTVATLHYGLWAQDIRHFAVLSGLSGAGKTMLARAYGAALNDTTPTKDSSKLLTVAVQPGWYDPSAILGYVNPLNEETYVATRFLRFLMQAASDPETPHTVVFDEMNLSHPEQYLAPLLSAMETGGAIHLHSQGGEVDGIPGSIPYPRNLVIIGTVNMDETTQGLSDKVLDRAFVREFWDVKVDECPQWKKSGLGAEEKAFLLKLLNDIMEPLRSVRLHFGWRVIEDILRFAELNHADQRLTLAGAADAIVYAKVVPKLRGDDTPSLRNALKQLEAVLRRDGLSESARKVSELVSDLEHTGTARFWR